MDKKQKEMVGAGLGLVTLGAGSGLALLPRLAGRAFGISPAPTDQAGIKVVIRALGFRDIAFGLGLLLNRDNPKNLNLWLRLFSLCMAGDALACLPALRKPRQGLITVLGGVLSVGLGLLAWQAAD